jgi:O-antigen/teichoic acid export membrane protein
MGPTEYGQLGIATASIDLFTTLAGLGLGITATKHIAELRVRDPERAGRIIGVSTIVAALAGVAFSLIFFALAPYLAAHTLAAPQLTVPLRVGTLTLFFASLNGAQTGALYGLEAFRAMAILQAVVGVLDLPFLLGGYFFGGLSGVLFGMAVSRFANWLVLRHALNLETQRYGIPRDFRGWKKEAAVLWHFSIPAALGGIMVLPVNWICSALLVNQPNGYAQMGAYNAANQWYTTLMLIPSVLGVGLLPIISERMGVRDGKTSGDILKTFILVNGALLFPCCMVMSLLSPLIMGIYGPAYRDAWPTLIVVLWTAAILGIQTPVGDVIVASGRMWVGLLMNTGWAAVYILATYLLLHRGSLGLASSRLIAYAIHATWTLAFAYKVIAKRRKEGPLTAPYGMDALCKTSAE